MLGPAGYAHRGAEQPTSCDPSEGTSPASLVPDIAENLEIRGMLDAGASTIGSYPSSLVVWQRGGGLVVIVGNPDLQSVRLALQSSLPKTVVMLRQTRWQHWASFFAAWEPHPAARFIQPETTALHLPASRAVSFSPGEHRHLVNKLPLSFAQELLEGHAAGDVVISLEADSIAGYCFPSWITANHFDLNVVTLPQFRRRGHAFRCCSQMLSHFSRTGKRAQWFTETANGPSQALCRRLGFQFFESVLLLRPQHHVAVN